MQTQLQKQRKDPAETRCKIALLILFLLGAALIAALLIGLCNAIVRPVLVVLTLPVTVITLGLFLFVINALMFWAASGIAGSGFQVHGFWAALIGSLLYSIISLVIESLTSRLLFRE